MDRTMEETAKRAAAVIPSERQVAWNCMEFYGFVHFGLYTFCPSREGDMGPECFNPTGFDARQWTKAMKAAGMSGLLLTCKHHEGFCLWPSKYTEFSVKNSPWRDGKGDVVREVAEACRLEGLKFGVYLSPWDMHEKTYGTKAYDTYFKNQLTELCSEYGELFCVWFDGACRSEDVVQDYDWEGYYAIIRRLQPRACISICGPDVRWIGNEAGVSRDEEWSVVPRAIMETERNPGYWRAIESVPNSTWKDIGSRAFVKGYDDLIWYPAEVDVSIRPSWGYVEGEAEKLHSLEELTEMYEKAVGGNANFLLNVPPNREGRFDEADVRRLGELGDRLRRMFEHDKRHGARAEDETGKDASDVLSARRDTYYEAEEGRLPVIQVELAGKETVNLIAIKETIEHGQHVEEFAVEAWEDGSWKERCRGTTVGYQRLCRLEETVTDRIRLRILRSRGRTAITEIGVYWDMG